MTKSLNKLVQQKWNEHPEPSRTKLTNWTYFPTFHVRPTCDTFTTLLHAFNICHVFFSTSKVFQYSFNLSHWSSWMFIGHMVNLCENLAFNLFLFPLKNLFIAFLNPLLENSFSRYSYALSKANLNLANLSRSYSS